MSSNQNKLIVCAGTRHKNGWLTHDVQAFEGTDIVCDFWELPQWVEPNSINEMEFTHALEHFPMDKSQDVLKLLYNLLAPNGELYIEVPNFYWHAEEIIINPSNRQIIEYAFGGQLNEWDYHYNGYTPDILIDDLQGVGFEVLDLAPNSSIEARVIKR
jgi:hypothetical protein